MCFLQRLYNSIAITNCWRYLDHFYCVLLNIYVVTYNPVMILLRVYISVARLIFPVLCHNILSFSLYHGVFMLLHSFLLLSSFLSCTTRLLNFLDTVVTETARQRDILFTIYTYVWVCVCVCVCVCKYIKTIHVPEFLFVGDGCRRSIWNMRRWIEEFLFCVLWYFKDLQWKAY